MKKWNSSFFRSLFFPHAIIIIGFAVSALMFYYPLISGKTLIQSDIRQYEGMSRQLKEYRKTTGDETYWIDNAFGGMPTYQLGAEYPADFLSPIYSFVRILPRPAHILFLYLLGGYLLLLLIKIPWPAALFGAVGFGFSTYLLIILQVGHNTKALAISFFPFVLSGMILLFRRKWFWGFLLSSIALGMQIRANHYQMTYYLLMLMGVFVLVYAYDALKKKQLKFFLLSVLGLIGSGIMALGLNTTPLLATAEYTEFSTRGKSDLQFNPDGTPKEQTTGLDYDYITEYSYGIFESLNLIVPRIQGGGSSENLGTDHGVYDFLIEMGGSAEQALAFSENVPTYWGEQPILEAPAYIGISLFFFAILGFFLVKGPLRNALALGILFSLLLSWGKNFSILTDFFIQNFPLYNKFRAVSSIQVVLELCIPVLASLGVSKLFYDQKDKTPLKKFLKIALFPMLLLAAVFLFQGALSFTGQNDDYFKELYGAVFVSEIVAARKSIFQADLIRAIVYCIILIGVVYLYLIAKLKREFAIGLLLIVVLFDLIGVSNRYIDRESFVTPRQAQIPFQLTAADRSILQDSSRYRVFEVDLGLTGARTSYFHNAIGGYHGAKPRRFEELFKTYTAQQNAGILDFLNVKYILYRDQEEGSLKPLLNPNALGPAWFVTDLKTVDSPDEMLLAMKNADFKTTALLLKDDLSETYNKTYVHSSEAEITLVDSKPDHLTYKVNTPNPAFVVFSEMFYPKGWTAKIDGVSVPIYHVNYVLRGLSVSAQSKIIEFVFEPEVVRRGTTIRWITFILFILVTTVLGYFQYFRKTD